MGSLLGKDYLVVEQIGRGGMAVVYLVEHQTLHKRFAAKVLSVEHASSEEARARFTQEAHAASQLDHENIVTISDFGITADQRPYYVMELLRGRTLMDRIEEGPMSLEEVVAVSVPIARALAHAHAEGVIHRDVKPENVFLVQRSQGRWGVKVLDFGIAKVTTNPALTKMGQALGSPMFMAPEACRGDDVDQRADLYSFGILLYLMLTGRVPFSDESLLKILQMQVSAPVPSMREINPALSPELEAVVLRALAKNADDRYPTMEALLFDLQAVLPEGSDNLLMQAQFGTSLHDTPFPSQSLRMMALSSQRHMIGDKDASTQLAARASAQLPSVPAPKRRRGALIAIALLTVLAAGGVGVYLWQQSKQPQVEAVAIDKPIAPAPKEPTPSEPAPSEPPPAAPRVVGPTMADTPPTDPPPTITPPPVPAIAANPGKPVVKPLPPPTPKRPAITTATPPKPTALPTKPDPVVVTKPDPDPIKPAVVVAPVVVPPKETAPPPVVVVPKPTQPAVIPPADTGSLDATPSIASLDVNGPLPSSVVRRGVERIIPALRACYRAAAKAGGKTPLVNVSVSFEIDESSVATGISAARGTAFGSLHGCVRGAVSRLQTQQAPDVGTVQVVLALTFRPT
ncbi:MAG: serine/threonine protein kinase [Deltaproteobacteria bacterium]|nr:serine/threonine protein kinase [Deltaproteobacteria bacterium]